MSQARTSAPALPEDVERLALLGWALFPALATHRALCFEGANKEATHDLDQLARWAADWPGCNWRVNLGRSGLWVLDVDVPGADHEADGRATLQRLLAKPGHDIPRQGGKPHLPMTRSGGGGWAWVFSNKDGERLRGSPRKDLPGLDPLRGEQSMTVPPSIHVTTRVPYRWITAPWDVSPQRAPGWLLKLYEAPPPPAMKRPERDMTSERGTERLIRACSAVESAGDGNRNNTLNLQAFMIGQWIAEGAISREAARVELYEAAMTAGLEPRESVATIDGAFKRAAAAPRRGA